MSASEIRVVTAIVSHNQFDSFSPPIVESSISFNELADFRSFATLSSNNPNNRRLIEGLIYVPTLTGSAVDICADALQIVPENAVRLSDLPATSDYPLIAIFPWTSSSACTEQFIFQARIDAVRGAFVYQPGSGSYLSPQLNWRLSGDRGNYIIRWNPYPLYALSGTLGSHYLSQSATYSANMSASPNGAQLEQQYDPLDYPRLLAQVRLQERGGLPFTWVTIIITLSVLLGICILSAVVAHFMRRRQRRDLRRRVERGEVDLQSLGIKKLNVPQEKIDQMPKFVYRDEVRTPSVTDVKLAKGSDDHTISFTQSTCPVCLDDFVENETEVRELPCKHIFHPECIDIFLRDRSSLCPLCKKSALPHGYHPEITDIMVRRERLARRIRASRERQLSTARRFPLGRWSTSAATTDVELGRTTTRVSQPAVIPPEIVAQGHEARAAWRREQLARQQDEQYSREAEATRQADVGRPLWRRVMGRIIPGTD